MKIEAKLAELGLVLPEPLVQPPGARLPFPWVRIRGQRAFISSGYSAGGSQQQCVVLVAVGGQRELRLQGGTGLSPDRSLVRGRISLAE